MLGGDNGDDIHHCKNFADLSMWMCCFVVWVLCSAGCALPFPWPLILLRSFYVLLAWGEKLLMQQSFDADWIARWGTGIEICHLFHTVTDFYAFREGWQVCTRKPHCSIVLLSTTLCNIFSSRKLKDLFVQLKLVYLLVRFADVEIYMCIDWETLDANKVIEVQELAYN